MTIAPKIGLQGHHMRPCPGSPPFFVRAYLRDDAVCGDFMLGLVPPLCSASGSGKVNKYNYYIHAKNLTQHHSPNAHPDTSDILQ